MTIRLLCILFGGSFLLGLALTPLARRLALRYGMVDRPDGQRKMQGNAVPLGGGVAVLLAAVVSLALMAWDRPVLASALSDQANLLAALLLASIVLCLVGLADDFKSLRGRHKLLGQLFAVGIVISAGQIVTSIQLFSWHFELGVLALPFTAFWLLGAINSLNLIDGMDGLLSSVGTIVTLALAVMAVVSGHWEVAAVAVALAGALAAFLCFNFPPASIYLGDCGSMVVGLIVGVLAISSSLKAPATVALASPAALLIIPIFDTLTAIVRRKLTGRSIYSTDRAHIHHCLLNSGMSTRRVLALISVLCVLTVLGVLGSLAANNEWLALLAALTVVGILIVTRLFGYAEFLLIKERLRGVYAASRPAEPLKKSHTQEVRLQGSVDWKEVWASLTTSAEQLNLISLCLDVNIPALHEGYHARWAALSHEGVGRPQWQTALPLVVNGHEVGRLDITGVRDGRPVAEKIGCLSEFAEYLEQAIGILTAGARSAHRNGHAASSKAPDFEIPAATNELPPAGRLPEESASAS
jgi:UDP-GlcNAc:undecaprenyl-phosphate/decaprenyl-phosphate GlcNAc-1-phosphate transferase